MRIRQFSHPEKLPNTPNHLLAFDLELANSFRTQPSVICMVGIGSVNPETGQGETTIASITCREEERELLLWLMDKLEAFCDKYQDGELVSFSGLDNDIRWINERLERLEIADPQDTILARMPHRDLKVEFFKRTQNGNISLKKLEEVSGISRSSTVSSKKVSYVLTDLVRKGDPKEEVPDRLHEYLAEDVYHLLVIQNRWEQTNLDSFNLTDTEFHTSAVSLAKTTRRFISSPKIKNGNKRAAEKIRGYLGQVETALEKSVDAGHFRNFKLPAFPDLTLHHSEFERIRRKHETLNKLEPVDPESGAYRFQERLFKPKGALAVVQDNGRLLLIRRADKLERAAGYWGLPGGTVEKGETPSQCALRELREEVNLHGEALRVLGSSLSFSGEYELFWVEVRVEDIETLHSNQAEVAEARWLTPQDVTALEPLIPGALEGFSRFLGPEWNGLPLPQGD